MGDKGEKAFSESTREDGYRRILHQNFRLCPSVGLVEIGCAEKHFIFGVPQ
jgi:hypothetical protein